jgi:hypothetical protein
MRYQTSFKLRPGRWWPIIGIVILAAGAAFIIGVYAVNPSVQADKKAVSADVPAYALAPATIDDSGLFAMLSLFSLPVQDPHSLESIRDSMDRAGYRGVERIEADLASGIIPPFLIPRVLVLKAKLYLYEGEYLKASTTMAEARTLMEKDSAAGSAELDFLIKLQGIAALRRGETENCVECGCMSSCIFPIMPEAVHAKKEGSTEAIGFFMESLKRQPENPEDAWLLNIAYMTLGRYPNDVPPLYRLPVKSFNSEMDIGQFTDIASNVGVNRFSMAGGAIMEDFDNDGLLDIVVSTQDVAGTMAYFHNRGDGTFENRTAGSGLDKQLGGLNCGQTDYNNDGRADILVCRGGWTGKPQRPSLLRNNGDGTFTDVTEQAGVSIPTASQVGVWADYDNDGLLDLFVGGETGRSYLYHNRGDGTFEEVAVRAGVDNAKYVCKGANWGDFDQDGYPDLFVSNFDGPPRLFHNNRNGTFTDVAPSLGITQPVQGFSCWFWDYDNDGWPDLFVCGYERRLGPVVLSQLGLPNDGTRCKLYHNQGGVKFEDVTKEAGLDISTSPMGTNFADFDNDGYLDFYLGTGSPNYRMLVPNRMFKNVDGKRFVDITTSSRTGHLQKGHGVACGDWDRDGNIDIFEELGGAVPGDRFRCVLFQNPGHKNHWVTLKLEGKKTNRAAIGARIKMTLSTDNPRTIYRYVTTGSSFGGNPFQQTIGIGKATQIESLEIYWPTSKTTQVFRNLPADQAFQITEFEKAYRPLNWKRLPLPKAAPASAGA